MAHPENCNALSALVELAVLLELVCHCLDVLHLLNDLLLREVREDVHVLKLEQVFESMFCLLSSLCGISVLQAIALSLDEDECFLASNDLMIVEQLRWLDSATSHQFIVRIISLELHKDLRKRDGKSPCVQFSHEFLKNFSNHFSFTFDSRMR